MPRKSKNADLGKVLDRLQAAYGTILPSEEPVEAGILALLARHAPSLDAEKVRDALRGWFVNWNEARVAETWEVTQAMEQGGDAQARAFATAMLRFLRSLHDVLNRCSFVVAVADAETDVEARVEKMRGAPPEVRAVMLAVLAKDGSWYLDKETSKCVQALGLVPKTSSARKAAKSLEGLADPADRLRAHYLLARYASRGAEDPDPLAPGGAAKPRARKSTGDASPAKTTSKRKPAAGKTAAKASAGTRTAKSAGTAKKSTTRTKAAGTRKAAGRSGGGSARRTSKAASGSRSTGRRKS